MKMFIYKEKGRISALAKMPSCFVLVAVNYDILQKRKQASYQFVNFCIWQQWFLWYHCQPLWRVIIKDRHNWYSKYKQCLTATSPIDSTLHAFPFIVAQFAGAPWFLTTARCYLVGNISSRAAWQRLEQDNRSKNSMENLVVCKDFRCAQMETGQFFVAFHSVK